MRRPFGAIYVVVGNDGELCNFADSREVAEEMRGEKCEHGHREPHHVYEYSRFRKCRGRARTPDAESQRSGEGGDRP